MPSLPDDGDIYGGWSGFAVRGADFVRGWLLDTADSRSCRGVVGREFPSDLVICVARGGGANEDLKPIGFGLTDGLGEEVGAA